MSGSLTQAVVAAASALQQHSDWLRAYLSLFLRDDIASWQATQPAAAVHGLNVGTAVNQNVAAILGRLQPMSVVPRATNVPLTTADVGGNPVHALIATATSDAALCKMESDWHPWF